MPSILFVWSVNLVYFVYCKIWTIMLGDAITSILFTEQKDLKRFLSLDACPNPQWQSRAPLLHKIVMHVQYFLKMKYIVHEAAMLSALLALLPRTCILHLHITMHLHPAIAYNHELNTQLSITAYINSSPKNGVFAVQQEKEQQLLLVNYRVSNLNGVGQHM